MNPPFKALILTHALYVVKKFFMQREIWEMVCYNLNIDNNSSSYQTFDNWFMYQYCDLIGRKSFRKWDVLSYAFYWAATPQGCSFWERLNDELEETMAQHDILSLFSAR